MQYSYYAAYTEVRSSNYYAYMGIDTSKALSGQTMSDTAKALLGVTDEGITWDKYLLDKAKSNLTSSQSLLAAADKEGFTWNDDMQADYDDLLKTFKEAAKKAGYSYKNYIKAMYGTLVTQGVFEDMAKESILLSAFQNNYLNSLNYTDEQIQQYYQENQSTFNVAA